MSLDAVGVDDDLCAGEGVDAGEPEDDVGAWFPILRGVLARKKRRVPQRGGREARRPGRGRGAGDGGKGNANGSVEVCEEDGRLLNFSTFFPFKTINIVGGGWRFTNLCN